MQQIYYISLPFVNAFNFSQIFVIPLIFSIFLTVGWSLSGRGRFGFIPKIEIPILFLIISAVVSSVVNILYLNSKSLNHLAALPASFLFFYYFAFYFSRNLSDAQILRSIWFGYCAASVFAIVEFYLVNFKGADIGATIPRVAVENYEPIFLGIFIRSRGPFEESGHFASFIAICIPFLTYYHFKLNPTNLGRVLFVVLTAGGLFSSFSISAFIFIPLAYIFLIFIKLFEKGSSSKLSIKLIFYSMAVFTVVLVFKEQILQIFLPKFTGPSFEDRFSRFSETIDFFLSANIYQLLIGFGPASYQTLGLQPAVSVYLNALRDYGIIGLLFWFLLLCFSMINSVKVNSDMKRATFMGLVLVSLYFMAIPNYFYPHIYLPFIFLGRILVARKLAP